MLLLEPARDARAERDRGRDGLARAEHLRGAGERHEVRPRREPGVEERGRENAVGAEVTETVRLLAPRDHVPPHLALHDLMRAHHPHPGPAARPAVMDLELAVLAQRLARQSQHLLEMLARRGAEADGGGRTLHGGAPRERRAQLGGELAPAALAREAHDQGERLIRREAERPAELPLARDEASVPREGHAQAREPRLVVVAQPDQGIQVVAQPRFAHAQVRRRGTVRNGLVAVTL